jgi:hypothetical protein
MHKARLRSRATFVAGIAAAITTVLSGVALAAPTAVSHPQFKSSARPRVLTSTTTELNQTDRCGGAKGWLAINSAGQFSLWGDLWENPASCGGPGTHQLWVSYLDTDGDGMNFQIENGDPLAAGPGQTLGFNDTTGDYLPTEDGVEVTLCSTEGGWHCGLGQFFPNP